MHYEGNLVRGVPDSQRTTLAKSRPAVSWALSHRAPSDAAFHNSVRSEPSSMLGSISSRSKRSLTIASLPSLRKSGRISQSTTNVQAPAISILRRSKRLSKSEKPSSFIPIPDPKRADPITNLRSKRRPRDTVNTRSSANLQERCDPRFHPGQRL